MEDLGAVIGPSWDPLALGLGPFSGVPFLRRLGQPTKLTTAERFSTIKLVQLVFCFIRPVVELSPRSARPAEDGL